jgi:hypothetical protein
MGSNDVADAAHAAAMERLAVLKALPVGTLTDDEKKEKLCAPTADNIHRSKTLQ